MHVYYLFSIQYTFLLLFCITRIIISILSVTVFLQIMFLVDESKKYMKMFCFY